MWNCAKSFAQFEALTTCSKRIGLHFLNSLSFYVQQIVADSWPVCWEAELISLASWKSHDQGSAANISDEEAEHGDFTKLCTPLLPAHWITGERRSEAFCANLLE